MKNLIFKKIIMKNFKSHEYFDFNYEENKFVAVTGANGAGKTSGTIDALTYCLYDVTTKNNKSDSVIRKRSGKNLELVLTFAIDDDEYKIENYRKHDNFGEAKILTKNGKDISGTTRAETNTLISQIVMPFEVFVNCILFSQYVSSAFVSMTPSEKQNILDNMLSLDYSTYYTKAGEYCNELEKKVLEKSKDEPILKSQLAVSRNYLAEEIDKYKKDEARLKEELQTTQIEIKEITNEIHMKEAVDTEYNSLLKTQAELQIKIQDIKSNIDDLEGKRSAAFQELNSKLELENKSKRQDIQFYKYEEKTKLENKKKDLETQKVELEGIKTAYVADLKAKSIQKADDIKTKYNKNISDTTDIISKTNTLLQTVNRGIKSEEDKKKDKTETITSFEKFLGKQQPECPTCHQSLNKQKVASVTKQLNEAISDKEKIESTLLGLTTSKKEHTSKITQHQSKLKKLEEELESKLEDLRTSFLESKQTKEKEINIKIIQIDLDIANLITRITNIDKEKAQLETLYTNEVNDKQIQEENKIKTFYAESASIYNKELSNKIVELQNLNSKIEKLKSDKDRLDVLERSLNYKQSSIDSLRGQLVNLFKNIKQKCNDSHAKIKGYKDKILEIRNSNKDLKQEFEISKFWKKAFSDSGIKTIILDEAIPILNRKAIELCNLTENIKVRFDSQTTLKSGEQRNKFFISAVHSKNLSEFNELSGGEARLVNIIVLLSLRYLLETMYDRTINLLLLDEILDSLDDANSMLVIDMIRKISEDHCVILVSHILKDCITADETLAF